METVKISGNIVDVIKGKIFAGSVHIKNGKIAAITQEETDRFDQYILPGFIDAHVHIESSMLVPSEFARLAVVHGTVATVSDPHEIANVLGKDGVRYMVQNGSKVPFHFYFGVPSCVPATAFETAGAAITPEEVRELFEKDKLLYLSEMMNYPGVLKKDPLVMEKIQTAKELGFPIDGHAPGLRRDLAKRYFEQGISTDHECFALDEAKDKIRLGVKILIREGSAAKNYRALHPLISIQPEDLMFCSDDKHPNDLVLGHIDQLVRQSIVDHGYDTMDVLRIACLNPIAHYNLDVGVLQKGSSADCIVVNNLREFKVLETYIKGELVAKNGKTRIQSIPSASPNNFKAALKKPEEFTVSAKGENLNVIGAKDGELITEKLHLKATVSGNVFVSNKKEDVLKIAVVNRYCNAPISVAFVKGFGLKSGALASSIAHDSHNIVAVGVEDEDICKAVNALIEQRGGISAYDKGKTDVLPLPVAGIMSGKDGYLIAEKYSMLNSKAKEMGTTLASPFMTLSFMALLVIPRLKISDKGLFDGETFAFSPLSFAPSEKSEK